MARGIIIFGSSGSGKTTLGKLVAEKLKFTGNWDIRIAGV